MQRILRRAAAAKRHADRRIQKQKDQLIKIDMDKQDVEKSVHTRILNGFTSIPLKHLKEDWERGPLAPRREGGIESIRYGYADARLVTPPGAHLLKKTQERLEHKHGVMRNRFVKGDRVAIIRGPHFGVIHQIDEVDYTTLSAKLKDAFIAVIPPASAVRGFNDGRSVGEPMPSIMSVSLDDIRLVKRVGNRDVIVDKMEVYGSTYDTEAKEEKKMIRLIPTTDVLIDKSAVLEDEIDQEDEKLDETALKPSDTFRSVVEQVTFEPIMSMPPFPPSVLDELRNKYSDFKTRFDDKYVRKQLKADEKVEKIEQTVKLMTTPGKEFYAKQAREAYDLAQSRTLSDESLSLLGQYMQKKGKVGSSSTLRASARP